MNAKNTCIKGVQTDTNNSSKDFFSVIEYIQIFIIKKMSCKDNLNTKCYHLFIQVESLKERNVIEIKERYISTQVNMIEGIARYVYILTSSLLHHIWQINHRKTTTHIII